MTSSPQTDRERAEDDAAAWLVLLSEAPDDAALLRRFETWRQADALHEEIWTRTSRAYDLAGRGKPRHRAHWASYAAEPRPERVLPPQTEPGGVLARPAPAHRPWLARHRFSAAAMAVAAVLAVIFLPGAVLRLQADALTGSGELRTLTLADGSRVSLAPESAISVAFAGQQRHVRLLKGEAFFEVARDPSRPFSVAAGNAVAVVLGTGFDVRRDGGGVVVAVEHGHVRVDDDAAPPAVSEDLQAGDWVRVAPGGSVIRGTARPEEAADWRQGRLIARNRPAAEIVDRLRPYYPGIILIRDDVFIARLVSGIYDLRHPEQTLRELAASHGAAMRRISPWLLIVSGQ